MSQSLEFNPSMGSAENHLEAAKNRLLNAQAELESAREDGKPKAQIEALEQTVKQYQEDVDSLQKDIEEKSMGVAA